MISDKGDLNYAAEKFGTAIEILATTHGTLQERLLDAWECQGHHVVPIVSSQGGIPMSDALIGRLGAFNERMSCQPGKAEEGTFAATILRFTDDEATHAANELFSINDQIETERSDSS